MKKNKKRKKSKKSRMIKMILIFIAFIAIAITLLILEIKQLMKQNDESTQETEVNETIDDSEGDTAEDEEEIFSGITFDTFVDKIYTQSEIESLSNSELVDLLNAQYEVSENSKFDYKNIVGSAENESDAENIAREQYDTSTQIVDSVSLITETEKYYIMNVAWTYVSNGASRASSENVVVLKNYYYNMETSVIYLDDLQVTKQMLDIENYVKNRTNSGKRLIQSFIEKSGNSCEYVLYYFSVNYGQDNVNDTMDLVKKTVSINAETGEIESTNLETIKSEIVITD